MFQNSSDDVSCEVFMAFFGWLNQSVKPIGKTRDLWSPGIPPLPRMRAASEVRKSAAGRVQRRHGGGIGALEFKSQVKVIGRSASARQKGQLKLQNDQNDASKIFQDLPSSKRLIKKLTKKLTHLFQDSQNFFAALFFAQVNTGCGPSGCAFIEEVRDPAKGLMTIWKGMGHHGKSMWRSWE